MTTVTINQSQTTSYNRTANTASRIWPWTSRSMACLQVWSHTANRSKTNQQSAHYTLYHLTVLVNSFQTGQGGRLRLASSCQICVNADNSPPHWLVPTDNIWSWPSIQKRSTEKDNSKYGHEKGPPSKMVHSVLWAW